MSCARAKARSRWTGSGGGTARSTSAIAASTKMPLGARPVRSIRPPVGRLGRGGDSGLAHRRAVRPAGMAVDPLQPDRPVADDGVEVGGGREAAEAPALLVPAAADDPARGRVGGGIGADPRLRLVEAVGVGEVELERAEAEAHDMAVGVDQARDQRPAAAVRADIAAAPAGGRRAPSNCFTRPSSPITHAVEAEQPAVLARSCSR